MNPIHLVLVCSIIAGVTLVFVALSLLAVLRADPAEDQAAAILRR
jgi:hypothetical protein